MEQYNEYKDSGARWIGEIPKHWKVRRLKTLLLKPLQYGANSSGIPFSNNLPRYIRITDINIDGKIKDFDKLSLSEEDAKPYLLDNNDVLFARSGATVGKTFIYKNEYGKSAFAGYLIKASLNEEISPDLLFLYTQSDIYDLWKNSIFIQSTIQNIGADKYSQLLIPIASLSEQQTIVSYLDNKVSKIDKYISIAEKKIAALDELKQVTIADAVTHGINPNASMKDSGIPWIGMVPEHWTRARYKDIFNIEDEKVGKRNDLTLLSLTKKGVIVRDLSEGKGKFPKDYESYKVVNPNNIILCLFDVDETPRTVGVSHNKGMITGAYDIFEIKNAKLEFIYYLYLSIDDKKGFKSLYKGLRKVIPLPSLLSAYINLPPISEQNEIVAYIDRKVAQIDKMKAAELAQIEKLKEYKQRLISDVVTGKVKVTNE